METVMQTNNYDQLHNHDSEDIAFLKESHNTLKPENKNSTHFRFAVTFSISLALTTLCIPLIDQDKIFRKQVPDSIQSTFPNNPQFQSDICQHFLREIQ